MSSQLSPPFPVIEWMTNVWLVSDDPRRRIDYIMMALGPPLATSTLPADLKLSAENHWSSLPQWMRSQIQNVWNWIMVQCIARREICPKKERIAQFNIHCAPVPLTDVFSALGLLWSLHISSSLTENDVNGVNGPLLFARALAVYHRICDALAIGYLQMLKYSSVVQATWIQRPLGEGCLAIGISAPSGHDRAKQKVVAARLRMLQTLWGNNIQEPSPRKRDKGNEGALWGNCAEAIPFSAFYKLYSSVGAVRVMAFDLEHLGRLDRQEPSQPAEASLAHELMTMPAAKEGESGQLFHYWRRAVEKISRKKAAMYMCLNCVTLANYAHMKVVDVGAHLWMDANPTSKKIRSFISYPPGPELHVENNETPQPGTVVLKLVKSGAQTGVVGIVNKPYWTVDDILATPENPTVGYLIVPRTATSNFNDNQADAAQFGYSEITWELDKAAVCRWRERLPKSLFSTWVKYSKSQVPYVASYR
ncbi:hypothetical protein B0H11DRAFT_2275223, partial [Mycena galericulata]